MINASLAHIWSLGGQREVDFELFGIKAIDINRIAEIADIHDVISRPLLFCSLAMVCRLCASRNGFAKYACFAMKAAMNGQFATIFSLSNLAISSAPRASSEPILRPERVGGTSVWGKMIRPADRE
jgi:hypothetical protein